MEKGHKTSLLKAGEKTSFFAKAKICKVNFEVRKSFVKDAGRLPVEIQTQLAEIISTIEKTKSLSELKNCKK